MGKKKLLLTNCGHSEVPLIVAAREMGWYIITTGMNAKGVGHALADETVLGDFRDPDFIAALAKSKGVEAILSGCEDAAYLSAAYAAERLSLPGHDTYEVAKICHNKALFRKVMTSISLPSPRFFAVKTSDEAQKAARKIGFPLIVKPPDLNSGEGMTIVRREEDLLFAFQKAAAASAAPDIIIEEYLEGTKHAANVFFKNQKVVQSFFDDEQYYINPYLVAGASFPSGLTHYTMELVLIYLEKIAAHLSLVDGMFHIQFIEKDGIPFLIDPCRRIPGGLYLLLIRYAQGFDCAKGVVSFETGEGILPMADRTFRRFVAREYIMTSGTGVIDRIVIDESIEKRIFDSFIWAKRGDEVKDPMNYKAGILYMEFSDYHEMKSALERFPELARIEFQ